MLLRYGALLFILPSMALLLLYGLEMSDATVCTENGSYYNPQTQRCEDSPVSYPSYYQRHPLRVNLMLLLSTIGAMMMTWGMLLKHQQRHQ